MFHIRSPDLLKVASGADQVIGVGTPTPFGERPDTAVGTPDIQVSSVIIAPSIEVGEDDYIYVVFGVQANEYAQFSQFMRCVYHGPA